MVDILCFTGFGLAGFALVCEIISVALEYWVLVEQSGIRQYSGLWKGCLEAGGDKVCSSDGGNVFLVLYHYLNLFFNHP